MKKISIMIIGLLICFSGCKKDEHVVRIAYMPALTASQLYVGIAKGYFEEEGIKVEILEVQKAPDIIPAIMGKSVDIGFSVVPPLITAQANGVKIKSIGGATFDSKDVREHRFMLPIDSEIKSAQDLRGKKIAVVAEKASDHLSLMDYLKANGIKKEEVEIISIPYPEMIFALTSKTIDVAAGVEPFITMGALEKKTRTFDFYYPDIITEVGTFLAHEDFINANPELIAKISRIIDKATIFINNEEEEFRKLLPTLGEHGIRFKMSKEVADSFTIMGFKNSITTVGAEAVMDMLIDNDVLKTKINAEDIIYSPK
jgi:NitT/TauT family transport system substrate-binding protein